MVKDVLQQIRDGSPVSCEPTGPEDHDHHDTYGFLTDGITWMSADQIDLLSDDEKKVVVTKMITRVAAHFDATTNQHRVDVTFSETVARSLACHACGRCATVCRLRGTGRRRLGVSRSGTGGQCGGVCVKKVGGQRDQLCCRSCLFRHRGVISVEQSHGVRQPTCRCPP